MSLLHGPVAWSQFGRASWIVARKWPLLSPPVLVLSHPRSGSSWVGETLGSAADAVYLREPLTQTVIDLGVPWYDMKVPADDPPELCRVLADAAFNGWPIFPEVVVNRPPRWGLWGRRRRRLVLKEVNLGLCGFFLKRYRPLCILLVRHPAAVALSHRKMGWLGNGLGAHGRKHGRLLRAALDVLAEYPEHRVVPYEELCADPVGGYPSLFRFARLTWSSGVEESIRAHSASGDREKAYGTFRHSPSMIGSWRGELPADELATLREAYGAFDLPWYRSDSDW